MSDLPEKSDIDYLKRVLAACSGLSTRERLDVLTLTWLAVAATREQRL